HRARSSENRNRRLGIVENLDAFRNLDVAHVQRVTNHHVGDVELDTVGDVGRIDFDLQLTQSLIENTALEADAFRDTVQNYRNADCHLLTGNERLEVDVQNLPLDRMALDLANQCLCSSSVEGDLDDSCLCLNVAEQLVEIASVEGQWLGLAAVTVND